MKLQSLALIVLCVFNFACKNDEDVVDRKVKEITITGDDIIEGATSSMVATVKPETALNKAVIWSVSDEAIATISETGILTASNNGSVLVTATATDGSGVIGAKTVLISSFVALNRVDLALNSIALTGSLIVEIKNSDNETMATTTTPVSNVKRDWNSFTFMPSVMLVSGKKYKVVARRSVNEDAYISWRANTNDSYALGESSIRGNVDLLFRTYSGDAIDQQESVDDTGYNIGTEDVWQEFVPTKK